MAREVKRTEKRTPYKRSMGGFIATTEERPHYKRCPFGGFKASPRYKRENRHWPNCNCPGGSAIDRDYIQERISGLRAELRRWEAKLSSTTM